MGGILTGTDAGGSLTPGESFMLVAGVVGVILRAVRGVESLLRGSTAAGAEEVPASSSPIVTASAGEFGCKICFLSSLDLSAPLTFVITSLSSSFA